MWITLGDILDAHRDAWLHTRGKFSFTYVKAQFQKVSFPNERRAVLPEIGDELVIYTFSPIPF